VDVRNLQSCTDLERSRAEGGCRPLVAAAFWHRHDAGAVLLEVDWLPGYIPVEATRMTTENRDPKHVQIQIQLDDDVAQGMYVNLAMVNHTETEFTVDVMYLQPQQPKAKVRARIISSPKHTKRLMLALQENIRRFEERFGAIELSGPNPADQLLQ
jgi:hypothetical protein